MRNYSLLSDEELAASGKAEAEDELIGRYANLVKKCCRPLFLAGGDSEDLIQEGMLGLLSAVRTFEKTGGASFSTYAEKCIKNRLFSAVKRDGKGGNRILNDSVPIDDEVLSQRGSRELEDLIINREYTEELILKIESGLSRFEKRVMELYLEGMSYSEIALRLGKREKSVDNAVQRVRKKLNPLKGVTGDMPSQINQPFGQESQK